MRGVAVVLLGMLLGLSGCVVYDDGYGHAGHRYEEWHGGRQPYYRSRGDDDGYRRERDAEHRHARHRDSDDDYR